MAIKVPFIDVGTFLSFGTPHTLRRIHGQKCTFLEYSTYSSKYHIIGLAQYDHYYHDKPPVSPAEGFLVCMACHSCRMTGLISPRRLAVGK